MRRTLIFRYISVKTVADLYSQRDIGYPEVF